MRLWLLVALTVMLGCIAASRGEITRDTLQGEFLSRAPVGWETYTRLESDAVAKVDVQIHHGGERSVSVYALDATHGSYTSFRQNINARNVAGKRVRFRAYLKTSMVDEWCGLYMRADSDDRRGIAFDNMYTRRIRGTTNWTPYDVVLDIPESAARLTIGVVLVGNGQLWIDDCTCEVVGSEVATTGDPTRSVALKAPIDPDLPFQFQNLDFEGELVEYVYPQH